VVRVSCLAAGARALVDAHRANGTPVLLEGHEGFAGFAAGWVRGGKGGWELDEGGFREDLGECEVPVKAFKYDETNPVGRAMKAREFVETYWGRSNKGMYMHQFQFPCSEDEQARRLCNQSKDLPVLGDNLLK
jgi:hypothetical protein